MQPPIAQSVSPRLAALAALSLLLFLGCGESTLPPTRGYLVISLDTLRAEAERVGRQQVTEHVQVRLDMSQINRGTVEAFAEAGATELVLGLSTDDVDAVRREIGLFAGAMF